MRCNVCICVAAAIGAPFGAHAGVHRTYAVVVGHNGSINPQLKPLHYADDDAAQYADLFEQLGAHVKLLFDPDDATRRLRPDLVADGPPTRAGIDNALWSINRAIEQVHREGGSTALYFIYSGHGDVQHGEGFLTLADGQFFRSDLLKEVLSASRADTNHVIIDACQSYFMVFGRGGDTDRVPYERDFDPVVDLRNWPNTGFLVSTSSAQNSHEWEALQSGVFSHEVRSALRGAADINLDGDISYTEIAAFVEVANQAIRNERFRPRILVLPPIGSERLFEVGAIEGRRLVLDTGEPAHFTVETADGIRVADVRPGSQAVRLLVPSGKLFIRNLDDETEFLAEDPFLVMLSDLRREPIRSRVRGAANEAFLQLFDVPFSPQSFAQVSVGGLIIQRSVSSTRGFVFPQPRVWWAGAGATAVLSGLSATFWVMSKRNYQRYESASIPDRAGLESRGRRLDGAATAALWAAAASAAVTFAIYLTTDQEPQEETP